MVSATARSERVAVGIVFLGALLLCGVCDSALSAEWAAKDGLLGALLLCGVCDRAASGPSFGRVVSRSSSALWCLRRQGGEADLR